MAKEVNQMATKEVVKKWLDTIVERLADMGPFVCKDWGGSVQFIFPDLKTGWLLKMKMDGTVESLEEKIDEEHATGTVELLSDTFVGIYEKTINPPDAYFSGAMKCRPGIEAMVKILAPTTE